MIKNTLVIKLKKSEIVQNKPKKGEGEKYKEKSKVIKYITTIHQRLSTNPKASSVTDKSLIGLPRNKTKQTKKKSHTNEFQDCKERQLYIEQIFKEWLAGITLC